MESARFKLEDDDYLVNVHFYTAKPSLSHGDLVFDLRSDLSQGGGMMRSILRTSPCQESIWQVTRATSTSHTQRRIISFTRAHLTPSRMVYYLTLLPCACIGIVGASRMLRRSASAKEQLHHTRGKPRSDDGRNGAAGSYSGWTSRPKAGHPAPVQPPRSCTNRRPRASAAEHPAPQQRPDIRRPTPEIRRRLSRE